jgi:hypothetical protein
MLTTPNSGLIFFRKQAADCGNLEEFKRLYLADTTRLEYRDSKGKGAIHFAAAKNHVSIIRYIHDHRGGKLFPKFRQLLI